MKKRILTFVYIACAWVTTTYAQVERDQFNEINADGQFIPASERR